LLLLLILIALIWPRFPRLVPAGGPLPNGLTWELHRLDIHIQSILKWGAK